MDFNLKLIITLVAVAGAVVLVIWAPVLVALPLLAALALGMVRVWRQGNRQRS